MRSPWHNHRGSTRNAGRLRLETGGLPAARDGGNLRCVSSAATPRQAAGALDWGCGPGCAGFMLGLELGAHTGKNSADAAGPL